MHRIIAIQARFGKTEANLTAPLYHYLLDTVARTKQPTR